MELPRSEMRIVGTPATSRPPRSDDEPDEQAEPVWREDEFVQDPSPQPYLPKDDLPRHVKTAADMVQEDNPGRTVYPDDPNPNLRPGMPVNHPEYGLGKIVQLTGLGRNCTATVNFVLAGEKTFRLANSPLRPAAPAG
jgi:DNA helicase-2/ATP-dependent DNA helicase PcrA